MNPEERAKFISWAKDRVRQQYSISVIETLAEFRDEQQTVNRNYSLRITTQLAESISKEITMDPEFQCEYRDEKYIISLASRKPFKERHPFLHDVLLIVITAALTLATQYILNQKENRDQRQQFQLLNSKLQDANSRIDSLIKYRSIHNRFDSSRAIP